ncbi:MAG: TetR/AcrR family transcriptional regulator [Actinomycetia bacterium]|nr:TetR/AcrR family transcriptional regulator [Actinomycetes bacterium]
MAPTLSPELVLEGALTLADEIGIEAFTIRKLAATIDAKPMSIYHHLPSKEAIIDGMVDLVFAEIELPPDDTDWKTAMGVRARSARAILARHQWAAPLMESRTNPGPATLGHHDAVLGCLRRGGLSVEMTAHAYAVIDAFIYGFALQEASLPATSGDEMAELVDTVAAGAPMENYPHMMELVAQHVMKPGYDFGKEFDFGLDLILNGLEAAALDR